MPGGMRLGGRAGSVGPSLLNQIEIVGRAILSEARVVSDGFPKEIDQGQFSICFGLLLLSHMNQVDVELPCLPPLERSLHITGVPRS